MYKELVYFISQYYFIKGVVQRNFQKSKNITLMLLYNKKNPLISIDRSKTMKKK